VLWFSECRWVLNMTKALLQLLLKIAESVTRLEALLLIPGPNNDDIDTTELERFRLGTTLAASDVSSDDRYGFKKIFHRRF